MLDSIAKLKIKPAHVDLSENLSNVFGTTEREKIAIVLVLFAQCLCDWSNFKRSCLAQFLETEWQNGYIEFSNDDVGYLLHEAEQNSFLEYDNKTDEYVFTYSFVNNLPLRPLPE